MWTGRVIESGELAVLTQAARWFVTVQVPQLAKALAGTPMRCRADLLLAELAGCAKGPFAWLASARGRRAPRPA